MLYTDYENIAIVHSCFSLGVWKMEQQWVLTRNPITPDDAEFDAIAAKGKEILESQL